jgi:hypothetical protein
VSIPPQRIRLLRLTAVPAKAPHGHIVVTRHASPFSNSFVSLPNGSLPPPGCATTALEQEGPPCTRPGQREGASFAKMGKVRFPPAVCLLVHGKHDLACVALKRSPRTVAPFRAFCFFEWSGRVCWHTLVHHPFGVVLARSVHFPPRIGRKLFTEFFDNLSVTPPTEQDEAD